jgi:glutathionylspermidine synthase-like protein
MTVSRTSRSRSWRCRSSSAQWEQEPPAIYGRFDLAYDGKNPPKLLEYNADTSTSLLEAAVVQWYWLQDVFPKADQFNSIHERLVAKWKELKDYLKMPLYLTNMDTTEDTITVAYMRDTAEQAGLTCKSILVEEIGWDQDQNYFVDLDLKPIRSLFKLYPWEWLLADEFGEHTLMTYGETQWVEPIWKMVLSNKGILAILWEMHPNHPNLLETYFDSPRWMSTYAKKPLLAREGANITLTTSSGTVGPTECGLCQKRLKHPSYSTIASTSPAVTDAPSATITCLTVPFFGDFSSFCIFIASTTSTPWPASTSLPAERMMRTTLPGIGARSFCGPSPVAAAALRLRSERGSRTSTAKREFFTQ